MKILIKKLSLLLLIGFAFSSFSQENTYQAINDELIITTANNEQLSISGDALGLGDDILVTAGDLQFLLKAYDTDIDKSTPHEALFLGKSTDNFYVKSGGSFVVFVDGKYIDPVTTEMGNHMLLTYNNNQVYLLEDIYIADDYQVFEVPLLSDKVVWMKTESGSMVILDHGVPVNDGNAYQYEDLVTVYNAETESTYLLKYFKMAKANKIKEIEALGKVVMQPDYLFGVKEVFYEGIALMESKEKVWAKNFNESGKYFAYIEKLNKAYMLNEQGEGGNFYNMEEIGVPDEKGFYLKGINDDDGFISFWNGEFYTDGFWTDNPQQGKDYVVGKLSLDTNQKKLRLINYVDAEPFVLHPAELEE